MLAYIHLSRSRKLRREGAGGGDWQDTGGTPGEDKGLLGPLFPRVSVLGATQGSRIVQLVGLVLRCVPFGGTSHCGPQPCRVLSPASGGQ